MSYSEMGRLSRRAGQTVLRMGLALVLVWIGAMKFTAYEAASIQPLVASSALMSWAYEVFSVRAFSALLGTFELAIGLLIALGSRAARLSALGSVLAAVMFLVTLSFLLTTPGWEPSAGGFPALSVVPGQFLVKDVVLFGAALWATGDALSHL